MTHTYAINGINKQHDAPLTIIKLQAETVIPALIKTIVQFLYATV